MTYVLNGTVFSITDVNTNGEFIGKKYEKFLWIKYNTLNYRDYKIALNDGVDMGFWDGKQYYTANYIERRLNDMLRTGLFVDEATKLYKLFKEAEVNISIQNEILKQLESKFTIEGIFYSD